MFLRFVKKSKSCLSSSKLKIFVLGNDSSDLDSVVSSLVYSYFKQEKHLDEFDVIPVCCIPKNNMKLKKDVILWLKSFGIDPENELVFLNDVRDLISDARGGSSVRLCLLDHHKPQAPIMSELVREVIDHRNVSYVYPDGQLEVNHIKLVGSCCTLVAMYIIENQNIEDSATLLRMLRGVILVDTDCLASNNGRTTTEDIYMVEQIEDILGKPLESRQIIFDRLSLAKSDISGFGINMMIQRDLKILEFVWKNSNMKLAIPTLIGIDVEDLMAIEDLESQLTETLKDLEADMIIGLTCGTSSRNRRGYLIISKDHELTNRVSEYLLLPEHNMELLSLDFTSNINIFYNNDLHITRKIFIPFIEKFFAVETKKQHSEQMNNCSANLSYDNNLVIKTDDCEAGIDIDEGVENEGAPYTLSTPLRSYSGSPDNRNSDMTLPSLNNRHTLQLVDKKRQKHHDEMDVGADMLDENQDFDKMNNDDVSPLAFTPENSDDEWIPDKSADSKKDILGSSTSFHKHFSMTDEARDKKDSLSENTKDKLILKSENVSTDLSTTQSASVCDTYSSKFSNFSKEDDSEFMTLEEKVDKKRQKLHSNHIESIASALVKDVLRKSQTIVVDEINVEAMLSAWSESYADEEKKQIINSLNSNDLTKLAELLTTSLIKDCLKVQEIASLENDLDANNSAAENYLTDTKPPSSTGGSVDSDDDNSMSSLDIALPGIEINDDTHLGNMINDENQNIFAACVNSSSADVVENSSFNLYRRISSNKDDFSEDEKELLMTAGDWLPKEEIIYSDSELEEHNENHHCSRIDNENDEVPKKIIVPDKEAYMDTSNLEINTSTDISLNCLDQMITPDLDFIEQLESSENADALSQGSSNKLANEEDLGDLEYEDSNIIDNDLDTSSVCFEKYKVAIYDAGHYMDAANNNERTQLLSLSSCDFPDKSDQNYQEIMQYIFECTIKYLESVDAEFYTIVYFHSFGNQQRAPSVFWLHQCYQSITHRLKKNLKHLYIVHPTIWVRAALFFSRFFINSKFYSKIQYVSELEKLGKFIPTSGIRFPPDVLQES